MLRSNVAGKLNQYVMRNAHPILDHSIPDLPNFAIGLILKLMSTMNISLPESLKSFVDEQVGKRGYGTSSEYVRELIRRDQDRVRLRGLLLAGAESPSAAAADDAYFDSLRQRVRQAKPTSGRQ
jgi:Predicted transcriptional regulators containing the CopG/Arc/MetJ DNA-binding domain